VIATSGQAKVAYDVTDGRNDDRPPVLLFHAGVTDGRSWVPLVEALGPGHSTIAFDRRGFGDTRYQPEPHSHVTDALAVLDAARAGSAPVAVVAASMGRQAGRHRRPRPAHDPRRAGSWTRHLAATQPSHRRVRRAARLRHDDVRRDVGSCRESPSRPFGGTCRR
jgi:pimeloyl-ACP methyl ester carboxylesterase